MSAIARLADGAVIIRRGTAEAVLTPATADDFAYINANLRELDRFEQDHFLRHGGCDRRDCLDQMEKAWTLRLRGEIVGYVGLQLPPMASPMTDLRFMPMLSTVAAARHTVDYARLSRPVLEYVIGEAPPWVTDFLSIPLARYAASVRWHERTMGWRRLAELDIFGERAILFHISRKDIKT